jgi:hypothetical protein
MVYMENKESSIKNIYLISLLMFTSVICLITRKKNVGGDRGRGMFAIPTMHIHIQSTTVYVPSSGLRLSHPLPRQRVCPSPRNQRGGAHLRAGEGLGESQFQRLEKKLSTLSTLRLYTKLSLRICANSRAESSRTELSVESKFTKHEKLRQFWC